MEENVIPYPGSQISCRLGTDMDFVRSWDEWVPEDRVLPPTEENYAQQQKLRELANPIPTPPPKKKGAAPDGKKAVSGAGGDSAPKGVKRSRDHDIEKVINPSPSCRQTPVRQLILFSKATS